jgi:hypothetical protein
MFVGLGLVRHAHYKPEVWVLRSAIHRKSSFELVCGVLDAKRLTISFYTILNRPVVSEANLNHNLF